MKKLLFTLIVSVIAFSLFAPTSADARNLKALIKTKSGKASNSWVKSGIRKFKRKYAEGSRAKIISGSEKAWRKYPGKKSTKVTHVTYSINGNKRNVAYVWSLSKGRTFLMAVANRRKQESLDRTLSSLLRKVK